MVINLSSPVIQEFTMIIISIAMLWIAKIVRDMVSPFKFDEELKKSNMAVTVALSGYFVGIVAILIGAYLGPSKGFVHDIISFIGYGVLGIILMNISYWVNDKLILYRFPDLKELVEDRNVGTGAVHFGANLASGLIIAGSISGEGGGVHTAIAFYILGQIALFLFTLVYDFITPYNLQEEIEIDNVAVGVGFGGNLAALGIILLRATMGDFVSWPCNLVQFGLYTLAGLGLIPLIRLIFGKLFVPKIDLNQAVTSEQNIAAGVYEMVFAISIVLLFFFMLDFGCKV